MTKRNRNQDYSQQDARSSQLRLRLVDDDSQEEANQLNPIHSSGVPAMQSKPSAQVTSQGNIY